MAKTPIFLFDFDGVIVDTLEESFLTNSLFVKELGLPPFDRETFRLMYNKNIHDSMIDYGVKEEDFVKLWLMIKTREKSRVNKVTIYQDIDELMERLKKYSLYIVSSSSTKAIESYLKRKELSEYFQGVLGAEEGISKEEKIKRIVEKEKMSPQEAYFITDTVGDVIEGKKTGVKVIAVAWGYHRKSELQKASPDYLYKTPRELIEAIPNL